MHVSISVERFCTRCNRCAHSSGIDAEFYLHTFSFINAFVILLFIAHIAIVDVTFQCLFKGISNKRHVSSGVPCSHLVWVEGHKLLTLAE